MKKTRLFLPFLLVLLIGCGTNDAVDGVIAIDVSTNLQEKELLLQDFMDVEYIPLETNDDFVTQGVVMAVGDKYILTKNWQNDGGIFVFDRANGKGIRKINRKGQGAEEYTFINGIVLDEENGELFVNDANAKKIYVYDLFGNFKRSFHHVENGQYMNILDYDREHLICYDMSVYEQEGKKRDEDRSFHMLISKQDGKVTSPIYIPFDVVKAPCVIKGDYVAMSSICPIIPFEDKWLLVDTSTDTVYSYVPDDEKLYPFLVKAPTENPEIMLSIGALTDRFLFMHSVKKDFDFNTGRGFLGRDLVYDKQEGILYEAEVINGDFVKKQSLDLTTNPLNRNGLAAFQVLSSSQLLEAYEKDDLKGTLKDVAAGLNEESNPVVMLMKYRR